VPHSLILAFDGARATITLNRPDRHNALAPDDLARFVALLDEVEDRPEVRVLVVTGTGDRTFCAGFDIAALAAERPDDNPFVRLVDRLAAVARPSICALNGSVYGGGAEIALACDLRIGVEGMRMFVPAARLGLHYPVAGLKRYVQRLGLGPAKRLLLAGETFAARELLRVGYLDYLVAPGELAERTDALARDIAGLAPLAVGGMKRTLDAIAGGALDEAAAEAAVRACFESEDFREGQAAHAERRRPRFRGR